MIKLINSILGIPDVIDRPMASDSVILYSTEDEEEKSTIYNTFQYCFKEYSTEKE